MGAHCRVANVSRLVRPRSALERIYPGSFCDRGNVLGAPDGYDRAGKDAGQLAHLWSLRGITRWR